jgi:hypothetical protein
MFQILLQRWSSENTDCLDLLVHPCFPPHGTAIGRAEAKLLYALPVTNPSPNPPMPVSVGELSINSPLIFSFHELVETRLSFEAAFWLLISKAFH